MFMLRYQIYRPISLFVAYSCIRYHFLSSRLYMSSLRLTAPLNASRVAYGTGRKIAFTSSNKCSLYERDFRGLPLFRRSAFIDIAVLQLTCSGQSFAVLAYASCFLLLRYFFQPDGISFTDIFYGVIL